MYADADNLLTYSPPGAGTLAWKYAGGPKAEYDIAQAAKKDAAPAEALSQRYRQDTFDHDKDTASMYDDQWVYSNPGKNKMAIAVPAPVEALHQRKDTFDGDSGSASMYDDGHVYSEAGQFRPSPPPSASK